MLDRTVFRAKVVLVVYLIFAMSAIALALWSNMDHDLDEALVPMTGWTGLFQYTWTIFFAVLALAKTVRPAITSVVWMLGGLAVIGAFTTAHHAIDAWSGKPDYGNPYLMYHPIRPLFTVLIPGTWASILWFVARKLPPLPSFDARPIKGKLIDDESTSS